LFDNKENNGVVLLFVVLLTRVYHGSWANEKIEIRSAH